MALIHFAAVLLVLALTGCGGSGGGDGNAAAINPTTSPPPPSGPNNPPVLSNPIPDQRVVAKHAFSYDVSQGGTTFTDPDGDALTYSIAVEGYIDGLRVRYSDAHFFGTPFDGPSSLSATVTARDPRGGMATDSFFVSIAKNAAPELTRPNGALMIVPGAHVNYDVTQGGTTFTDSDGDKVTYQITFLSPPRGFGVEGTHVVGAPSDYGIVTVRITGSDDYGGSNTDLLTVAVAAPEPGEPVLPTVSYVYEDAKLPLPWEFANPLKIGRGVFQDTTPAENPTTDAGATLGRVLFYDKRLSVTNTHACASCHRQDHGFAAPEQFSSGVMGVPQKRNSMGLTNVRYNWDDAYFIDFRVRTLEKLSLIPIEEPTELASSLSSLEQKLAATDFYPRLFEVAFGTPEVNRERIAKALAQFLRALLSYRSKYDQAYSGMEANHQPTPDLVFTPEERRGDLLFSNHCGSCHSYRIQLMRTPTTNGLDVVSADPGGAPGGVFRATSLRNVAMTAPYMHDGRFASLREVIDHYDHGVQKPIPMPSYVPLDLFLPGTNEPRRLNLSEDDKNALEAFLHTLTDESFLTDPRFSDPFQ
jgi:cytochrome c peroxidase